jgi:HEAT repeat protein
MALLGAPEEPIVRAALRVAGEMDPAPADLAAALAPLLVHPSAGIVTGAADLLARHGGLTPETLIDASRRAGTPEARQLLVSRLAGLGEGGRRALLDLLRGDPEGRALALAGLAALPPEEARPALLEAAASTDPAVRRDVFQGFVRLGRAAGLPPEAALAGLSDPDPDVRFAAAWAAGACGVDDPEVLGALRRATADEAVLPGALRAFLLLGPAAREAAPEVRALLRHAEPLVRRQAVEALAAIAPGEPETRRALDVAAKDADPLVRETARRALGK